MAPTRPRNRKRKKETKTAGINPAARKKRNTAARKTIRTPRPRTSDRDGEKRIRVYVHPGPEQGVHRHSRRGGADPRGVREVPVRDPRQPPVGRPAAARL